MPNHGSRIMVAGATGYIGGGVLQACHKKGFWIRALCRDKARLPHQDWCDEIFVGEATKPETLRGLCDGIDVVFSSIGVHSFNRKPTVWDVDYQANINILEESRRAGVKHFIFVTTIHAEEMAKWSPIAEARLKVAQAIMNSGLEYNILAPTGFFNDMLELFKAVKRMGWAFTLGDGRGKINPISALDLGEEVARLVEDKTLRNTVRQVGGRDTFTHRQIAELAFKVLGKRELISPFPAWLIGVIAQGFKPFNYNVFALLKFFEFTARAPEMVGEPVGERQLEEFFRNIAKGMNTVEAEAAM